MASELQPSVVSETSSDDGAMAAPSYSPPASSNARPRPKSQLPPASQPIKDAVNSAFDSSDIMSSQVSSSLVQTITEAVIHKLKLQGVSAETAGQVPGVAVPSVPLSMSNSAASIIPPRDVYTPPSPDRDEESVVGSASDYVDIQTDGHSEVNSIVPPLPEKSSQEREETKVRPSPLKRGSTEDGTTLEKIWQRLFDKQGHPTSRLGQFLRGLALHMIEDYEPCNSLVITPQKMLRFYDEVRILDEIYPWTSIFGGKMTNSSISHLYRDLNCQHHFVQKAFDEKPSIPALTPLGFETWMTTVIRAHPDEEFHRFAKAVIEMPISNADNRRERFPKQLSRRLFPTQPNEPMQELFEDSVLADQDIELPKRNPVSTSSHQPVNNRPPPPAGPDSEQQMPKPPPPPPPTYATPANNGNNIERERQPYSTSSSEGAMDETLPPPPPQAPLERERKPYSAAPSAGRSSDNGGLSRSNTTATGARPRFDDELAPRAARYRTGSTAAGQSAGFMGRSRRRSPSAANGPRPYARSESEANPGNYASGGSNKPDDSEEELSRTYSRDSRSDRKPRYAPDYQQQRPPPPRAPYEDDYQRRGPPPPPPSQGGNGYPNQPYMPLLPRYGPT